MAISLEKEITAFLEENSLSPLITIYRLIEELELRDEDNLVKEVKGCLKDFDLKSWQRTQSLLQELEE